MAWADLVAGKVTTATLEMANKGMLMGGGGSTALMHKLAAVQAGNCRVDLYPLTRSRFIGSTRHAAQVTRFISMHA